MRAVVAEDNAGCFEEMRQYQVALTLATSVAKAAAVVHRSKMW